MKLLEYKSMIPMFLRYELAMPTEFFLIDIKNGRLDMKTFDPATDMTYADNPFRVCLKKTIKVRTDEKGR